MVKIVVMEGELYTFDYNFEFDLLEDSHTSRVEMQFDATTKTQVARIVDMDQKIQEFGIPAGQKIRLTIETVDPPKLRPLFFEIEALLTEVKEMELEVVQPALIQHDLLRRLESLLKTYEQEMDYR